MSEQWKNNEHGEDDVQMPLGTGGDGGDSPYLEEPKSKVNTSTMTLIASFIAALAVLYLLGLHNKPRSASAEQAAHENQVRSAITDLLQKNGKAEQIQSFFKDTEKLVQMCYHYLGAQASKSAELAGNPFAEETYAGPAIKTPNNDALSMAVTNASEAEKLRRVAETFNTLKLQSVMVGKNSVAMINNQMVQVGGNIKELTVTAIEPSRVLLSYGNNTFELKVATRSLEK